MDHGLVAAIILYAIFVVMSIIYLYMFRKDKMLIHVYLSLVPTFICVFLLMNYHYYQPSGGAKVLGILVFVSIASSMLYWLILTLFKKR
ncbi:hypothetical protein NRIC_15020 [Enterococcus florum]|uniref:Uncharacterized protein n=1 Tax=Enterococcus florum TaxID=2480627 RepID=A0A4P5PBE4_9ENTE|nr:hypothetical protein [Enterococcus florum]GCF93611.1 hypothetical protein NRIC_15020 [Enterococcus florum]